MAEEQELDLVKMASTQAFAVCKIMDYSKYKFEQQKKEKEMRKNQKVVESDLDIDLIAKLKYGNKKYLAKIFAKQMSFIYYRNFFA